MTPARRARRVSYVRLDGSGGGDLAVSGAGSARQASAAVTVGGAGAPGAVLVRITVKLTPAGGGAAVYARKGVLATG